MSVSGGTFLEYILTL